VINSQKPRSEAALRERHTETCPRISDTGSERVECRACGGLFRPRKDGMPRGHGGPKGSECRHPTEAGQDAGRWTSPIGRKRLRGLLGMPIGKDGPTIFGGGDMLELLDALEWAERRHLRYSAGIDAALGDRELAESGEPMRSDAQEIRRIKQARTDEWETVAEYDRVLRKFGCDFEDPDVCIDWLCARLAALTEIAELLHGESEWTPEDAINAVRQLLPPDAECEEL